MKDRLGHGHGDPPLTAEQLLFNRGSDLFSVVTLEAESA